MTTLTDYIKNSTGFADNTIDAVLNALNTFLNSSLRTGEEVKLEGLGTFKITDKPERQGRNPRTGEQITFKAIRKPKLSFVKSFVTSIQPDPAIPAIVEQTPIPVSVANSVTASAIPPIPADLLPQPSIPELSWQIKAPDGSFIEAATSELSGWGVTGNTPIYSPATGWKLAGKVPELAGIVS